MYILPHPRQVRMFLEHIIAIGKRFEVNEEREGFILGDGNNGIVMNLE